MENLAEAGRLEVHERPAPETEQEIVSLGKSGRTESSPGGA